MITSPIQLRYETPDGRPGSVGVFGYHIDETGYVLRDAFGRSVLGFGLLLRDIQTVASTPPNSRHQFDVYSDRMGAGRIRVTMRACDIMEVLEDIGILKDMDRLLDGLESLAKKV